MGGTCRLGAHAPEGLATTGSYRSRTPRLFARHLHEFPYALDLALAARETSDHAELPWLGGFWLRWRSAEEPRTDLAWDGETASVEIRDGETRWRVRWSITTASVEIDVLASPA